MRFYINILKQSKIHSIIIQSLMGENTSLVVVKKTLDLWDQQSVLRGPINCITFTALKFQ